MTSRQICMTCGTRGHGAAQCPERSRLHRESVLGTSKVPDVTAASLPGAGTHTVAPLSYARDHTAMLFQQAKLRVERLREEKASKRDQESVPTARAEPAKPGMSLVRVVKRKGVGVVVEPSKRAKQMVAEDQAKDDEEDEDEGLGGLLGDYDSADDEEEEEEAQVKQVQKEKKEEKTVVKPKVVLPAPSELGVLDLPDWSEKEGGNVDEPKQEAKPRAKVPCKDFLKGRCDRGKRCKFAHDM